MDINVKLPEKLIPVLNTRVRYVVLHGGRGSAKSHTIARVLILRSLMRKERILCTRETQKSIRDSVHRLLGDIIQEMGLGPHFDITRDSIKCTLTGSEFLFSGLASNTVESIKSFAGVTLVWVEEAQTISDHSWRILIPTIREDGSQFFISMNPDLETDPTYIRFIKYPPPDSLVIQMNWSDNPWFPKALEYERLIDRERDFELYQHIWEGECRSFSDAAIFKDKFWVKAFDPHESWSRLQGLDFGYSVDPTTGIILYYDEPNHDLYIHKEVYKVGVEVDDLAYFLDGLDPKLGAREYVTRADSARPELISHLRRAGWKVKPANKWDGSVKDGYEYLRSFRHIYIHPSCENTINEFRKAVWAQDQVTKEVLPKLGSFPDHSIDAIRYALEPLIKGRSVQQKKAPTTDQYGFPLNNNSPRIGPGVRIALA